MSGRGRLETAVVNRLDSHRLALWEVVAWCAENLHPRDVPIDVQKPYRVFDARGIYGAPVHIADFTLGILVFAITIDMPMMKIVDVIWYDELPHDLRP